MSEKRDDETTPYLLRKLIEQGRQHSVVLLDPEGRITGWLGGADAMFGYEAREVIGEPLNLLFTQEDQEQDIPSHELRTARESGVSEDDRWQLRKDGTRIWIAGLLYRLTEQDGEILGFAKIMRDMTPWMGKIDTLENRIRSLDQAETRKKVWMGTLVHELANTFLGLQMSLQVARDNAEGREELLEMLAIMEREIELSKRLVEDLKEHARSGTGQLALEKQRMVLNDCLKQAEAVCRPLFEERRQSMKLLLPPKDILLEGDPTRLHEVFVNLLTNACKYTPEGGDIWLKMTPEGHEAAVRVVDTGIGIHADMLPRIFQLFTQEPDSVEQSKGGLGIGLWLVKNIVNLHGGTVGVRSEGKGKGSEFTVRLPI